MSLPWLPVDNEPKSLSAEERTRARSAKHRSFAQEIGSLRLRGCRPFSLRLFGGWWSTRSRKARPDIALGRYRAVRTRQSESLIGSRGEDS